jgi:hypothetical protein
MIPSSLRLWLQSGPESTIRGGFVTGIIMYFLRGIEAHKIFTMCRICALYPEEPDSAAAARIPSQREPGEVPEAIPTFLLVNPHGYDGCEGGNGSSRLPLKNLSDKRMIRVLRAAADRFEWTPAKAPSGRGWGAVCLDYLGTYVAAMAEIHVDKARGQIQVKRIVHAQDMGPIINPEGACMQIEGAVTMGLGYCLSEEIHFRGGEIRDLDFGSYQIPRFPGARLNPSSLKTTRSIPPAAGNRPSWAWAPCWRMPFLMQTEFESVSCH